MVQWLWSLSHALVAIVVWLDEWLHVCVGIPNAMCYSLRLAPGWFSILLVVDSPCYCSWTKVSGPLQAQYSCYMHSRVKKCDRREWCSWEEVDCSTWWNSTFHTAKHLLANRWPICTVLSADSVTKRQVGIVIRGGEAIATAGASSAKSLQ